VVAVILVLVAGAVAGLAVAGRRGPPTGAGRQTTGTTASPSGSNSTTTAPAGGTTGGVALGVYVKPDPASGTPEATLDAFESRLGHRLAVVQTFTAWQTASGATVPFPSGFAGHAESIGATPMITWQPEQAGVGGRSTGGLLSDQPAFSLSQISSGRYDAYIRSWAGQARSFGHVVDVRMMHEMNDKTYPWSLGVNGNSGPGAYVAAWRHIVGIFRAVHADNVQFVWCVGARPATPDPTEYFPGDSWVSWVAIDGYNRGTPWLSFTQIFSQPYAEVVAVSHRPVMIAETGSVEDPSDPGAKAAWISSAFDQEIPQRFPRVRAVLYFDAPGRGFSFALTSSAASLGAFARVAASGGYQAPLPT
jgi:hypothetical protein